MESCSREPVSPSLARTDGQERPFVFDYTGLWPHPRPLVETLAAEYGDLRFATLQGSYGWVIRHDQPHGAQMHGVQTLRQYLELFRRENPPALPYLMHLSLNRHLPGLSERLVLPREFLPNWANRPALDRISGPELFIGQAGTGFGPVHLDHVAVHVGFVQLEGAKEFLLFPPEDGPLLSPYPGAQFPWQLRNSPVRGLDPANLARCPSLDRAHPRKLVLKAGQALFLPANWWHTTVNLADSVSYSIRIVNHTNVLRTLREYALGVPRLLRRLTHRAAA